MKKGLPGSQAQSGGTNWEAVRHHQGAQTGRLSGTIRGHKLGGSLVPSGGTNWEAVRHHQGAQTGRQSGAIRGHGRQSVAIRGHKLGGSHRHSKSQAVGLSLNI